MHHRWKLFVYDGFVDVLVTSKELLNISEGDVCPNNGVPRNSWDLVDSFRVYMYCMTVFLQGFKKRRL